MKKIIFIFDVLVLILALVACQSADSTSAPDSSETTTVETAESTAKPEIRMETMLYKTYEGDTLFSGGGTSEFDAVEYTDETVTQTFSMEILGTTYTLEYENSAIMAMSDMRVHVYKLQNTEAGRIYFDAETGEIYRYISVPYNATLSTEAEYVQFIENVVDSKIDLSTLDYENSTHYYSFSENGMRSQVKDGFHVVGENERLGAYYFIYTKSINHIQVGEYVAAIFNQSNTVTLSIHDYNETASYAYSLLEMMEGVEQSVDSFLRSCASGRVIHEMKFDSLQLFIKNGVPHLCATIRISWSEDSLQAFSSLVETVTRIDGLLPRDSESTTE